MNKNLNKENIRFEFGENWADYIEKNFSDERVDISQKHLLKFLKIENLLGKIFLDIGCGSGLHSLAAWRAGAEHVISFDIDEASVLTTRRLHEFSGSPANWQILSGSVLDKTFLETLPKVDVLYSWGVLHHTGDMWLAIANAASRLKQDGVFYIALYSKDVYVDPPAEYWLAVKREYNLAGPIKKKWMVWCYAWSETIKRSLRKGKNPFKYIAEYKKSRGMSYWHDVRDWLGGYPMDFAANKEVESFAREILGLELINIKAGDGNTEYLLRFINTKNYWDDVLSEQALFELNKPFEALGGNSWRANLESDIALGEPEKFMLYENGSPVGWPNAPDYAITRWGKGRYKVDGNMLIFSATDNSDPNSTEKAYSFRVNFV
ncbi:class I SAM-dependent methyltransferase [Methylomonas sp. YC3]